MPELPKRVWITGASSGIGRAVALQLAKAGVAVVATARRAEDLASLAAEAPAGRIRIEPGDVVDEARMADIVARVEAGDGPIDCAILNAGIYLPFTAEEFSVEKCRRTFDVNLMGTVNGLAPLIPRMIARKGGRLVVTSSVAGYGGLPTSAAYGATKAGLFNLAASLKFDLDRHGVVIQVIAPGFVDTPATATNPFPMPFLMPVEEAAKRVVEGIRTNRFEIAFPRRFALLLKAMNLLPYGWYFPAVTKQTGWDKRPL
jgi:NAD(P)-dependent dehydrogenase (short-subunit alcohol dehydrogenase family)